jgi:hypothetical protein
VRCTEIGAGRLGTKGTGEITSLQFPSCTFIKAGSCEATHSMTMFSLHLPWKTKLEEVGGEIRNTIESSGAGEPGYEFECTRDGEFGKQIACEGKTSTSIERRIFASGGQGTIEGTFDTKSPRGECSGLTHGAARTEGTISLRLTTPALTYWWFSDGREPRWVGCVENAGKGQWEDSKCTKTQSEGNWETKEPAVGKEFTTSTVPGKALTLEATDLNATIECSDSGAGKLNEEAKGEITALSVTSCKFITGKNGTCEAGKPMTVKSTHLPWATKLRETDGEARDRIENSGKGEPAFEVECTQGGIFHVADKCEGNTSTSIERRTSASSGEGTLQGRFDTKSTLGSCSLEGLILLRLSSVALTWWWFLGLTN